MRIGYQPLCLRTLLLILLVPLLPLLAHAQQLDVEAEQFPGARRVKVESFNQGPPGFWAEYKFDGKGRAIERRGYRKRHFNMTEQYFYTSRNKLQQERVIDSDPDKRVQVFSYHYQYSPDSTRILREVCLSDADTMIVLHYLEFDQDNYPTRFISTRGLNGKVTNETQMAYTNGRLTSKQDTQYDYDGTGKTVYSYTFEYNAHGDVIKEHRFMSPPSIGGWFDGQGDVLEYAYDYSPRGPWTRHYLFYNGRKVLIARRTFTY